MRLSYFAIGWNDLINYRNGKSCWKEKKNPASEKKIKRSIDWKQVAIKGLFDKSLNPFTFTFIKFNDWSIYTTRNNQLKSKKFGRANKR